MTIQEFEHLVLDDLATEPFPKAFEAHAIYNPDGDCIEFFISNESFIAERVDDLVSVYYGRTSRTDRRIFN